MTTALRALFRHDDALLPTALALLYVPAAYTGGFALLLAGRWPLWLPGVLLIAHAMVIAAYLVHECAHNAVFRANEHNALLGRALLWFNGGCYGDYEGIRHKHMRHHVDRADVIFFDYRRWLLRRPLLRRLIVALEWLYIPAVDVLMHALVMALPFTAPAYRRNRRRVVVCLLIRGALLMGLALWSWPGLLGYAVAYLLFLLVLRLMDMHQHTYEIVETLGLKSGGPLVDSHYEQRNTYSNTLGSSALCNWLVLNFGHHNAHHAKPTQPWYRLPALSAALMEAQPQQWTRFSAVLKSYHRHRVAQVLHPAVPVDVVGHGNIGIYGVSFLTAL